MKMYIHVSVYSRRTDERTGLAYTNILIHKVAKMYDSIHDGIQQVKSKSPMHHESETL